MKEEVLPTPSEHGKILLDQIIEEAPELETAPLPEPLLESSLAPKAEEWEREPEAAVLPEPPVESPASLFAEEREPEPEMALPPEPPVESWIAPAAEAKISDSGAPLSPTRPMKPADHAAMAAGLICAGKTSVAVELQLAASGMTTAKARELADFMSSTYQQIQPQKGILWLRILGGVVLVLVNLGASLAGGTVRHSRGLNFTIHCFLLIGIVLFLSGLWGFFFSRRSVAAEDLIDAWRERKD